MPKYEKPSSMPEERWRIINEVVTNDTGETAQNFIKSFESEAQLKEHLKQVKQEASIAAPLVKAGGEILYTAGLYAFPHPTVRKLMRRRKNTIKAGTATTAGHLTEAIRRVSLRPFIKGYEDSLTNNYNKLHPKSQNTERVLEYFDQLGIKAALKAQKETQKPQKVYGPQNKKEQ